jgi:thiol-disulfide isomerase/thioredoxin
MKLTTNAYLRLAIAGILVAGLGLAGCDGNAQSEAPQSLGDDNAAIAQRPPRSPEAMYDFALRDLDGKTVRLSDYSGKVVLINFWATWCPPCRAELPDLIAAHDELAGESFVILGISLDQTGPAAVQKYVQKSGINFPILMGNQDVVTKYGNFRGIPTSFLLNSRHEQVKRYTGIVTHAQLTRDVQETLEDSA